MFLRSGNDGGQKLMVEAGVSDSINAGSVIRRTFNIYLDRASVLLPAAVVVFGITGALSAILVAVSPALVYASFLISDMAIMLFTAMVVGLVDVVQDAPRTSVGGLLLAVRPVLGELILVGIVAGIGIFVGFILLVVPGLVLATIWSVVAPVVVLERPGGLRALGRSRDLVRGNGWRVFCVIFVLIFLVGLLASGIDIAANTAGADVGLIVRMVVGIFTAPLGALAGAVLYVDLRRISSEGSVTSPISSATGVQIDGA
jgi:hypothetical protein